VTIGVPSCPDTDSDGVCDDDDVCFNPDAPDGLVSYWGFKEGTGIDAADSFYGNPGILTNGPVWTSGRIDNALNLDGVDDRVVIADDPSLDITGNLTISSWVKMDTNPANDMILSKYGAPGHRSYILYTPNFNQVQMLVSPDGNNFVFTAGICKSATFWGFTGIWHHVVGVYTAGEKLETFVDGIPCNSKTSGVPTSIFSSDTDVWIGDIGPSAFGSSFPLDGSVDEVAIYDRALNINEIQKIYADGYDNLGQCNDVSDVVSPNVVSTPSSIPPTQLSSIRLQTSVAPGFTALSPSLQSTSTLGHAEVSPTP